MSNEEISRSQLSLAEAVALKSGSMGVEQGVPVAEAIQHGKAKIAAYAAAIVTAAAVGGPYVLHGADRATEQPYRFVDAERAHTVQTQTPPIAQQHP